MTDQAPQNDPPNPIDPPQILAYRTPGDVPHKTRNHSIAVGCLAIWAVVIAAIGVAAVSSGQGFLPTIGVGGLALLLVGIGAIPRDRKVAYILGLFFGVLTVVGAALLLLVIVCGGTKWR